MRNATSRSLLKAKLSRPQLCSPPRREEIQLGDQTLGVAKISERSAKKPDFDTEWAKKVRVPPLVVVVFTRQLASMLATAVPIVQALDTLSHQSENPAFGEVVRICGQRLETGISFSHCVSLFPRVFPNIYKTMVQIGETTGSLDSSLDKLATWLERDQTIRHRVKSALSYPMFIMVLATGVSLRRVLRLEPAVVFKG